MEAIKMFKSISCNKDNDTLLNQNQFLHMKTGCWNVISKEVEWNMNNGTLLDGDTRTLWK